MCGICGVVNSQPVDAVEREALAAMNGRIAHRGPDDEGFYVGQGIGLAMRRLSIIDLATGHQPISNEDGTLWIVYNGEIYNHAQLRLELEARGHQYRTQSDTETILHLYEEYGRDSVSRLRGMFAFAIWDERRRRLFAARDRLGIKPFYYLSTAGLFLFASEIKALLAYPGVRAALNQAAIPEYLAFGYLSGEESMFSGILKLAPGHTLELEQGGRPRIERYWDLGVEVDEPARPKKYYAGHQDPKKSTPDFLGWLWGAGLQRARLCKRGCRLPRFGTPRCSGQPERVLCFLAFLDLARRRTSRLALERFLIFCGPAGAKTCNCGAHRRGFG